MLTSKDIEIGIWRFNDSSFPSRARIEDVDIFEHSRMWLDLSLMNPLMGELSPSRRRKLVALWRDTLPRLLNVRYLYVDHQLNQEFFNAICQMENLEGLHIKWSRVRDLSGLAHLPLLKHLYFGSTPGIRSLQGLQKCDSLVTLELENFKACTDFSPVFQLRRLELLWILSGRKLSTLEGIQQLSNLRSLVLSISVADGNAMPLEGLHHLEKLIASRSLWRGYSSDYLRKLFPELKYGDLAKRLHGSG